MSLSVDIHKQLGSFCLDTAFTAGENTTGVLGASGAGKSLTLRSIAGIVKPDAGSIVLNGRVLFDSAKRINLPPQQRHVGYLFQNYALFPNMTVEQNIACGLHAKKDRQARRRAVCEMIETMQLTGLGRLKPYQLSGGQQQRVALARILVGQPEILLLDEPFSALDSYLADQLRAELSDILRRFRKDTLLVTHSRDEAYELCQSLAVMENGRVVRTGDTHDVFIDPVTRAAARLTGCKNIVDARKTGGNAVFVPDWGVTFDAGRPVGDGLCAIGVRAHHFSCTATTNRFPVHITGVQDAPFEWHAHFHFAKQPGNTPDVLFRAQKNGGALVPPETLGVSPCDILLLYA